MRTHTLKIIPIILSIQVFQNTRVPHTSPMAMHQKYKKEVQQKLLKSQPLSPPTGKRDCWGVSALRCCGRLPFVLETAQ